MGAEYKAQQANKIISLNNNDAQSLTTLYVSLTSDQVIPPTRATAGSVGYDIFSTENVTIAPQRAYAVPTGIRIAIPLGYYARVAPKPELASKYLIQVLGGVIDNDYRGEIKAILFNCSDFSFVVRKGDPVAQLVIEANANPKVVVVGEAIDPITLEDEYFYHDDNYPPCYPEGYEFFEERSVIQKYGYKPRH